MGQPYGKTGSTSGWPRNFFRSITNFNVSQLNVTFGITAGVLITSLLAIGVLSNHIRESTLATLGTINICMLESQGIKKMIMVRTLVFASVINASVFTIGSLIVIGYAAVPLFAIGLFIISYIGVYPKTASIVMISAVVFSVGVALPGINKIPSGELFSLLLIGGLWGVLGVMMLIIWQIFKKDVQPIPVVKPLSVQLLSNLRSTKTFDPLISNMSTESGHFQFAVSFAITGAIGLLIAQELGLIRGYWVLITICVLLLRSDISVTFSFTAMRVIGTIAGAVIGSIIIANVHSIWSLYSILFMFASIFYAVRNVNYVVATLFLTPFVLLLLDILIPGQILLAQTRVLDTVIGAGISLLGVFIIWTLSYLKR